jgi:GNAT superfamily N-acetyltransferase
MSQSWEVEPLTHADVEQGLRLSTEAGWNQVAADWSYLVGAGQAFGVRADGQLIASGLALPYPPHFGWVSMVLVTERYRRRGLATLLVQTAVDHLRELGLVPILDATSEGREVYSRMGFVDIGLIDRWRGDGKASIPQTGDKVSLMRYAALDVSAFGADRMRLLADLVERSASRTLYSDFGYAIARQGRTATQIGPVVAENQAAGSEFVDRLVQAINGPIVTDVPRSAEAVVRRLVDMGFIVQRRFHRMALGRAGSFGDESLLHVIAGPELG